MGGLRFGVGLGAGLARLVEVDGFDHPVGSNEDGYLALKLKNKGFGKLFQVTSPKAIVWTTDRRIQIDGGLVKGTIKRVKRMLNIK